ncbi:MAG: MFS transporter [Anaerolineae bacterium]|nr:MFS transporter [Anaerolineae bacterium]
MTPVVILRRLRRPTLFVLVLLAIEFLDEFVFGVQEAAWPLIRTDLGLSYVQIGLLFSIPGIIAAFIEPVLGILGDVWRRRVIILSGGVGFGIACFLMATSHSFMPLLLATIVFFPSSGAFVALSQSTLMDHDPARHEHNMARWTFAGSLGVVGGSLALGVVATLAPEASWRILLMLAAILTIALWLMLYRLPMPTTTNGENSDGSKRSFRDGVRDTVQALRRPDVLRWLTLLQFSELMLDILHGYIALYFVDVVGTHVEHATLAVVVWTGVGLVGDFLLIPLLERVRGLDYLRVSAALEFVLFPAFLLVPGVVPKFVILGLLGFFNAGWYSVLQGQVYSAMPGQSGAVLAIDNVASLAGRILPFGIGLAAEHFGLGAAMWLFILGPIALLIGLPRRT